MGSNACRAFLVHLVHLVLLVHLGHHPHHPHHPHQALLVGLTCLGSLHLPSLRALPLVLVYLVVRACRSSHDLPWVLVHRPLLVRLEYLACLGILHLPSVRACHSSLRLLWVLVVLWVLVLLEAQACHRNLASHPSLGLRSIPYHLFLTCLDFIGKQEKDGTLMKGGAIIQHSLKETTTASPLLSAHCAIIAYITSVYQSILALCSYILCTSLRTTSW